MAIDTIRDEIRRVLESVNGIGAVHVYERWAKNWNTVLQLFKTDADRFHGWTVSRRSTARRQITLGRKEAAHVFDIRGIYGLHDAGHTELFFQDLLDSIARAFDADETLAGACATTHPDWGPMNGAVGFQIDEVGVRMFGNVLCHFAECRLCAVELLEIES